MYPMDLSVFLNKLMFWCSTKPGLSHVLLNILNFEEHAIRCRPAHQLRAGKNNRQGGLIGLSVKQAILSHGWSGSIMMGVQPVQVGQGLGQQRPVGMGIAPDPDCPHLLPFLPSPIIRSLPRC